MGTRRRNSTCHACGLSSYRSLPKLLSRSVVLEQRWKLDVLVFGGWTVGPERFSFVGRRVVTELRREVVVLKSRNVSWNKDVRLLIL